MGSHLDSLELMRNAISQEVIRYGSFIEPLELEHLANLRLNERGSSSSSSSGIGIGISNERWSHIEPLTILDVRLNSMETTMDHLTIANNSLVDKVNTTHDYYLQETLRRRSQ